MSPPTNDELKLAKRLFLQAKKAGKLKKPRGLVAVSTYSGGSGSASASAVTERDYLPEARQILRKKPDVT